MAPFACGVGAGGEEVRELSVGVGAHGAEFEESEGACVLSESCGDVEDGAGAGEFDQEREEAGEGEAEEEEEDGEESLGAGFECAWHGVGESVSWEEIVADGDVAVDDEGLFGESCEFSGEVSGGDEAGGEEGVCEEDDGAWGVVGLVGECEGCEGCEEGGTGGEVLGADFVDGVEFGSGAEPGGVVESEGGGAGEEEGGAGPELV